MKSNSANDSAFPSMGEINGHEVVGSEGMTIREWYAGQALVGILCNSSLPDLFKSGFAPSKAAEVCFEVADAMILEAKHEPRNRKNVRCDE